MAPSSCTCPWSESGVSGIPFTLMQIYEEFLRPAGSHLLVYFSSYLFLAVIMSEVSCVYAGSVGETFYSAYIILFLTLVIMRENKNYRL